MKQSKYTIEDVPQMLIKIMDSGIRAEQIACDLDVAFGTVKSWVTERRKPKKSVLTAIQHLYGDKVLRKKEMA